MKRICMHWTAGGLTPNATDKKYYHLLVTKNKVILGKYPIKANDRTLDPRETGYAAHCGGGNSYAIGIALCGHPTNHKALFTRSQVELMCYTIADLCKEYNIPITPDTVYTHYEFGLKNPKTSSRGKPDISSLPYPLLINNVIRKLKPEEVGDYLRNKVQWYYDKL
jgi:hypothetical protein